MSQGKFTEKDALAIYPGSDGARCYNYPACMISRLAVAEWSPGRRAYAHTRAGRWIAGRPVDAPTRGYPLYHNGVDAPGEVIYLLDSERACDALGAIGVRATTWFLNDGTDLKLHDWATLDGEPVILWLPDRLLKPASRHLWRFRVATATIPPLDWMRQKWDELGGDREKIREELLWMEAR